MILTADGAAAAVVVDDGADDTVVGTDDATTVDSGGGSGTESVADGPDPHPAATTPVTSNNANGVPHGLLMSPVLPTVVEWAQAGAGSEGAANSSQAP